MSSKKDCWLGRNFDLAAVAVIVLFAALALMGREIRRQLPFWISPSVQTLPAGIYEIRDDARTHVRQFGEQLRRQAAEVRAGLHKECGRLRADSRQSRRGIEIVREEVRRMREQLRRQIRVRERIRWE